MTTSSGPVSAGLQLRPFRPTEDVLPAGLPVPALDQDSPGWLRSLVALDHDRLVGVGWISLAAATDIYFVEVQVAESERRRGIGTALFAALCGRTDQSFPVCARVMSSQPWRREFAESLGYSVRVRYPGPWIDPTSESARSWTDRQVLPAGYAVRLMAEVPIERVIDAWVRYVEWGHRPFGPVHSERVREQWPSYADGLDAELSMITTDATGAVVAFSLVSPDGWLGRTYVVAETVDPAQSDGDAVLGATVAASVRALRLRGTRLVELEGHSTDPHVPALVGSLPSGGGDPMEIVELARPAIRN